MLPLACREMYLFSSNIHSKHFSGGYYLDVTALYITASELKSLFIDDRSDWSQQDVM